MAWPSKRDAGEAFEDAVVTSQSTKAPKRRRKQAKQSNRSKDVSERLNDERTELVPAANLIRDPAQEDKNLAKQEHTTPVSVQEQDGSAEVLADANVRKQHKDAKERHRKRKNSRLSRKPPREEEAPAKSHPLESAAKFRHKQKADSPNPGLRASTTTNERLGEAETPVDQAGTNVVSSVPLEDRIEAPPTAKKKARRIHAKNPIDQPELGDVGVDAAGTDRKSQRKEKHKRKHRPKTDWALIETGAGTFIDQDPILTPDDQHLILATRSEVRIYARSTSLLVRTLRPNGKGHIVSCILSSRDSTELVIAQSTGRTSLWNWTEAKLLRSWKEQEGLRRVLPLSTNDTSQRFISLCDVGDARDQVRSLSLVSLNRLTGLTASENILHRAAINESFQFFEEYGVLVGFAYKRLFIGHRPTLKSSKDDTKPFIWRELATPEIITSANAYINRKTNTSGRTVPQIDVAVGLRRGEIIIYQDVLRNLIGREKKTQTQQLITRGLHWHRGPVNTLKWSQDGNYIISGGNETVLVIWQLDTNQQQYLPHLATEILNLTVSMKGSAYAMRLADNSVMVLSTADLAPSTNISGLATGLQNQQVAAAVHPTSSEQLLLAVPRDCLQHTKPRLQSANQLQTWDYKADLQLRRQALTRNMITAINVGPGGQSVAEPHVRHLRISHDGRWLATIEEWHRDLNEQQSTWINGEAGYEHNQLEVTMKIWSHNDEQGDWELNTRMDAPHGMTYNEVLSLASNPQKVEFASAGIDNDVTIWVPRARVRDGVAVKDQSGRQLYTWSKKWAMHTGSSSPTESQRPRTPSASIAYSDDGSVLAATWPHNVSAVTYMIDCETGVVSSRVPGLLTYTLGREPSALLSFSGRHLIVVSDKILFYDTVDARTVSERDFQHLDGRSQPGLIAVSKTDGTFVVALNASSRLAPSRVVIFNANAPNAEPLLDRKVPGPVRALLACTATPGYVIIDGNSHIHQMTRPGQSGASSVLPPKAEDQVTKGLDGIFGGIPQKRGAANEGARPLELTTVQGITPSSKLESVLSFQSSSETPSARDLFSRIAGLFASVALPSQLRT